MIWQDFLLDQWIEAPALRAAIARAFEVPPASVAVVDDADQLLSVPESARIILERTREHREFPLQLMLVLRDDVLATRHAGFDRVLEIARRVARALDATVVFGEAPLAPYESMRVRASGELDIVCLEADEGDEVDSYFVASSRSFDGALPDQAAVSRRIS